MKILITGGAGYLGSVMTELFLNKGYEVTILDNMMYNQTSLINFSHYDNFKFINGDVRDKELLKELFIIGVLKDYHFMPLNTKVEPIAIVMDKGFYKICAVKINGDNTSQAIQYIESTFKK